MLGGGGGEGGKDDVRRIPDTRVSNPSTKVNRGWILQVDGTCLRNGPDPKGSLASFSRELFELQSSFVSSFR